MDEKPWVKDQCLPSARHLPSLVFMCAVLLNFYWSLVWFVLLAERGGDLAKISICHLHQELSTC